MKKIISVSVLLLLVFALCMGTMANAAEEPTVAVSSAENITAGSEVTLTVSLANNPGVMAFSIKPIYDTDVFEFVSYGNVTGFSTGWTLDANALWDNNNDVTYNGSILTITLKVKDDVKPGDYSVSVSDIDAGNYNEDTVNFAVTAGTVTVVCGHSSLTAVPAKAATCVKAGYEAYWECDSCHKLFSDAAGKNEIEAPVVIAIDDNAHVWGEGIVTTKPTCTETGVMTYTCENDSSHIKTDVVAATGHTMTKHEAVAATCAKEGNTEYYSCSTCKKLFKDEKGTTETTLEAVTLPIDETAHSWGAWSETEAATEEAEGEKTRTCENDSSHVDTAVIPKLDHVHKLTKVDAVAATCEEAGNIEYYTCSGCSLLFKDKDGTTEVTLAETVVKANGHETVKHEAVAATCTKEGTAEYYSCKNCTKLFSDAEGTTEITAPTVLPVDENAHDWGTWSVTTAATCTKEGLETRVCKNDETHTDTRSIDIDPDAHDWDEGTTTDPTCTEEGKKTYTCQNDSEHTKTEVIPALGHDLGEVKVKTEATCSAAGVGEAECSVCHEVVEVEIPKLEHTWDDGEVTKEATATTKGEKTWTCQVCGETKIVETPALGTSNSGSGDKTTGTANTKPQTGDETNVALWVVMMSVCAAGVVLTVSKKKTDK